MGLGQGLEPCTASSSWPESFQGKHSMHHSSFSSTEPFKDLMQSRKFFAGYASHSPGREEMWVSLADKKVWTNSAGSAAFFVHFFV